jgi:O-antigen/teichoic acid export membrane protein
MPSRFEDFSAARWWAASISSETRGLARDSMLLSIGTAATAIGLIAQVSLLTHVLGIKEYGIFALVIATVSLISRVVDLDTEKAVVTFGAEAADPTAKAGVAQFCYLVDGASGLLGFVVIAALAPFLGDALVGPRGVLLIVLYGLTLLASTVDTTSLAVLKLVGRFGVIAWYTILRESFRVAMIGGALLIWTSLTSVVAALVVHDFVMGGVGLHLAGRAFRESTGGYTLRKSQLAATSGRRRQLLTLIFHTNLATTASTVQGQAPALLLGLFRGPAEVGVFKACWSAAQVVGLISSPVTTAVLPRFARLWSQGRRAEIRSIVRQATLVAAIVLASVGFVLLLLRHPLLTAFAGKEAAAGSTVFVIAVLAQVVNGALFWNASLLYAAGRAATVSRVYLFSITALLVLLVTLAGTVGRDGAALALLLSTIIFNVGMTVVAAKLFGTQPSLSA